MGTFRTHGNHSLVIGVLLLALISGGVACSSSPSIRTDAPAAETAPSGGSFTHYEIEPSGGDDSDGIQRVLDEGSDLRLAPGRYVIESTLELRSGTRIEGYGAVLFMPPFESSSGQALIDASETEDVQIEGLTLRSEHGSNLSYIVGILAEDAKELRLADIRTEQLFFGIRLSDSADVTVDGLRSREDLQTLTVSGVDRGNFSDVDSECLVYGNSHNLYLERDNHNLVFDGVRVAGGGGYSLHLYHISSQTSSDITFRNVVLDDPTQGIVVWGYEDVTFEDVSGSVEEGDGAIMLNTLNGFTLRGFELSGGRSAVAVYNSPSGPVRNVNLLDGVYHQRQLIVNEDNVTNLVIEDVTGG